MYAVTSCSKASAGRMRQHAANSALSHQQQGPTWKVCSDAYSRSVSSRYRRTSPIRSR